MWTVTPLEDVDCVGEVEEETTTLNWGSYKVQAPVLGDATRAPNVVHNPVWLLWVHGWDGAGMC